MQISVAKKPRNLRSGNDRKVFPVRPMTEVALDTMTVTEVLSGAIRKGFGDLKAATKRIAQAARTNTRTAKNWYEGNNAPDATNLIMLMRESDEVFQAVLELAGRSDAIKRAELAQTIDDLRRILGANDAAA